MTEVRPTEFEPEPGAPLTPSCKAAADDWSCSHPEFTAGTPGMVYRATKEFCIMSSRPNTLNKTTNSSFSDERDGKRGNIEGMNGMMKRGGSMNERGKGREEENRGSPPHDGSLLAPY